MDSMSDLEIGEKRRQGGQEERVRGSLEGKTRQTWREEETGLPGEKRRQGVEVFPPRWCEGNRLSQLAGSISLTGRQIWLPVEQIGCC